MVGSRAEGGRLADVVEENSPSKSGRSCRGKTFEHHAGVNPDVAFGMVLGWLLDAFHGGDFGEQLLEKAGFVEEFETEACSAFSEELGEFVANAFRGDGMNLRGVIFYGGEGLFFDGKTETRGETDGAQHPQFVFGKTAVRVANGADQAVVQIGLAADVVEHFVGIVTHEKAVDGEVAARDIFLRSFCINDLIGMAAIGIAEIVAKRGDFDFAFIAEEQALLQIAHRCQGCRERVA